MPSTRGEVGGFPALNDFEASATFLEGFIYALLGLLGAVCVIALVVTYVAQPTNRTRRRRQRRSQRRVRVRTTALGKSFRVSHTSTDASAGLSSLAVKVEATKSKFDWTATGADSAGHEVALAYSVAIDGKPHPLAGDPIAATITYNSSTNEALDATWKDAKGNVYGI